MGTEISLDIGGLSIDWSKNSRGSDHGPLFQEEDRKFVRSDQIDYDYFAESGEDPGPMEMAFVRRLKDVVPRIELLGFTLDTAKAQYLGAVAACRDEREVLDEGGAEALPDSMSFEEFCAFATAYPVQSLDETFIDSVDEKQIRGRFSDERVTGRIPRFVLDSWPAYSERSYFGRLIGILHPYALLRVLAESPDNLEAEVVWQYGPLVEAGWASESVFTPGARRTQSFLIATEGSSDVHIISHAFSVLRPEIADFFRFIDVSEGHPFSGTGNLLKFAEGLVKIDVQNQIVFLFDNDAEGYDAYRRLQRLTLPTNMRSMMLPELDAFRTFPARGPEGVGTADINRRAAAIECYLDLDLAGYPPAKVVWTNYKRELDSYHGALEYKDSYTKAFLKQTCETLCAAGYDVSKLHAVLDAIVRERGNRRGCRERLRGPAGAPQTAPGAGLPAHGDRNLGQAQPGCRLHRRQRCSVVLPRRHRGRLHPPADPHRLGPQGGPRACLQVGQYRAGQHQDGDRRQPIGRSGTSTSRAIWPGSSTASTAATTSPPCSHASAWLPSAPRQCRTASLNWLRLMRKQETFSPYNASPHPFERRFFSRRPSTARLQLRFFGHPRKVGNRSASLPSGLSYQSDLMR